MTGKNYNWHKRWHWIGGRLVHDSGLAFTITKCESGDVDIETVDDTMESFQAFEAARGVPTHDLVARVQRLTKEAAEWYRYNRSALFKI